MFTYCMLNGGNQEIRVHQDNHVCISVICYFQLLKYTCFVMIVDTQLIQVLSI